jgi:gluconolactonase
VTVFRYPSNNSNGNTLISGPPALRALTRRVVRYEHDGAITIIADSFTASASTAE